MSRHTEGSKCRLVDAVTRNIRPESKISPSHMEVELWSYYNKCIANS